MTLEEQFISKINLNFLGIDNNIKMEFIQNEFLYYLTLTYQSPIKKMDTIKFEIFSAKKIKMISKIRDFNSVYSTIFPVILNIVEQFRNFLNNNPLFFVEFLKEKQILLFKELKKRSFINYNTEKLYDFLCTRSYTKDNLPKDMLVKKTFNINLIKLSGHSTNSTFFYASFPNYKVTYKNKLYNFMFSTNDSISLSFDDAVTFLLYFHVENNVFDIINNTFGSIIHIITRTTTETENNIQIEKFLLDLEMQNF